MVDAGISSGTHPKQRELSKRCWEIQSYTFTHRSYTVDERDVVLSGRVTFLHHKDANIPHQAKTISLHTHQAFFNPEWAPSRNLMYVPLKVLWDSVLLFLRYAR